MIHYNYETDFKLSNESIFTSWISDVILSEGKNLGEVSFVFCDDDYLLEINKQYLNHDYYTDIISFDYSTDAVISGDVFISIDRVKENASTFNFSFEEELLRVMIHGILHYCGYLDKSDSEQLLMRSKENEKIQMFHVKQHEATK